MYNNEGYRVISPGSVISITHCYNGVKEVTERTPIIEGQATILETDITTYVLRGLLPTNAITNSHINHSLFLTEKKSKKAEYRPINNGITSPGKIFISQEKIKVRDVCPCGILDVTDHEHPIRITSVPSTIIRTETKTFVVESILHHSPSGFIEIELDYVKGTSNTKKSAYTFATNEVD